MESALYDLYSLVEAYQKTHSFVFRYFSTSEQKSYARTFHEVISMYYITRSSHWEVSAAVSGVFVCKYDNGNFIGNITHLLLSPRIDGIRSIEKQSWKWRKCTLSCRALECSLKASWPWWMLPRIQVERDRNTRSKRTKELQNSPNRQQTLYISSKIL